MFWENDDKKYGAYRDIENSRVKSEISYWGWCQESCKSPRSPSSVGQLPGPRWAQSWQYLRESASVACDQTQSRSWCCLQQWLWSRDCSSRSWRTQTRTRWSLQSQKAWDCTWSESSCQTSTASARCWCWWWQGSCWSPWSPWAPSWQVLDEWCQGREERLSWSHWRLSICGHGSGESWDRAWPGDQCRSWVLSWSQATDPAPAWSCPAVEWTQEDSPGGWWMETPPSPGDWRRLSEWTEWRSSAPLCWRESRESGGREMIQERRGTCLLMTCLRCLVQERTCSCESRHCMGRLGRWGPRSQSGLAAGQDQTPAETRRMLVAEVENNWGPGASSTRKNNQLL